MEESNDRTLKLCATPSINGSRTEGFPDDGLTDVGSYEQRNARTQTIAFLEKFIQQQHYQTRTQQLNTQI